jgi:hypothetical protein
MDARGEDGERWWGRVPEAVTVRQAPMRAALPWEPVRARLCEAVATGVLAETAGAPAAVLPTHLQAQR